MLTVKKKQHTTLYKNSKNETHAGNTGNSTQFSVMTFFMERKSK